MAIVALDLPRGISSVTKIQDVNAHVATAGNQVDAAASAAPAVRANIYWVLLSLGVVALGVWWGSALADPAAPPWRAPEGIGLFAVVYLLAQVVERINEFIVMLPLVGATFTRKGVWTKRSAVQSRNQAYVAMLGGTTVGGGAELGPVTSRLPEVCQPRYDPSGKTSTEQTASAQQEVQQVRANTTVFAWSTAIFLACAGSGYFNIYLTDAIGLQAVEDGWMKVSLTGLSIGSGTKPLHDLITKLRRSKEQDQDPKGVGTSAAA